MAINNRGTYEGPALFQITPPTKQVIDQLETAVNLAIPNPTDRGLVKETLKDVIRRFNELESAQLTGPPTETRAARVVAATPASVYDPADHSDQGANKLVGVRLETKGGAVQLYDQSASYAFVRIMGTPMVEIREGGRVVGHVAFDGLVSIGGPQVIQRDAFWKK